MVGRFLAFGITACLPFVLVRYLTQVEFGTYKQAFLISGTLSMISQLGIATSLYYFLPNAPAAGRYVANTVAFLALMSIACVAALSIGRTSIAGWLNNPELAPHLPLIGLMTAFIMLSVILEMVMICRERYVFASATYALSDALRAVCFLIPVLLGLGLRGLFIGAVIATGSRVVAMLAYFKKEFRGAMSPDRGLFKEQLQYGLPFAGAILVEILQRNYHQYFVSTHFDAATFAIYAAGCLTIPFIDFVATPSGDVMMVKMKEAFAVGDTPAIIDLWHTTTRKLALLFFPLVVFSIVVSRELIITLYTKRYEASVPVFVAWTFAIVFSAILADGVLRVYADTKFLLVNNLIKLGLTAVLVGWFVRSFGLVGAVAVNLAVALIGRVASLARMKQIMKIRLAEVLPWTGMGAVTVCSIAAGIPTIFIKNSLHGNRLITLAASAAVYGVTYAVLAISLKLVTFPDLAPLWTMAKKVRTSFGWSEPSSQPEFPTSSNT